MNGGWLVNEDGNEPTIYFIVRQLLISAEKFIAFIFHTFFINEIVILFAERNIK